jgi:Spy/CpxP family protein refolding chaperone
MLKKIVAAIILASAVAFAPVAAMADHVVVGHPHHHHVVVIHHDHHHDHM